MEQIQKAWQFYRTLALLVGTVLAVLTFVALPYRYLILKHETALYALAWTAHGWIFPLYVIATFVLGSRLGWPIFKMIRYMIAGTIPLGSFFAERKVAAEIAALD